MYKNLALINGVILAVMVFLKGMLSSLTIDYIYLDIFSKGKIIGGALFLIGLMVNAKVDHRYEQENDKFIEHA